MSQLKQTSIANLLIENIAFTNKSKNKKVHQYFTVYFIAIILTVSAAIGASIVVLDKYSGKANTIITQQLSPLQNLYYQQKILTELKELMTTALTTLDVQKLLILQEDISLQAKKLSLQPFENQNTYKTWFSKQNSAIDIIEGINDSDAKVQRLKNKALLQLDTLNDAIESKIKRENVPADTVRLLSKVQVQITKILPMMQRLSLNISLSDFAQLEATINEMFVDDYGKLLASQKPHDRAMEELVRDFIHFEDLVLQRSILERWQANLQLMWQYQQHLRSEIKSLNQLSSVLQRSHDYDAVKELNNNKGSEQQLSMLIGLLIFVVVCVLLWFIRCRIKSVSSDCVETINNIIEAEASSGKALPFEATTLSKSFYCAETYQLLTQFKQLDTNRLTEAEGQLLNDQINTLEEDLIDKDNECEAFDKILKQKDLEATEALANQQDLEFKQYRELHQTNINQLQYLAYSQLRSGINKIKLNNQLSDDNWQIKLFNELIKQVKSYQQLSHHRYLQSENAMLNLSDVNLFSLLEAVVDNLNGDLLSLDNKLTMSVDEHIISLINIDVDVFTSLINTFISLLYGGDHKQSLMVNLQLIDRSIGQQKIYFSGKLLTQAHSEGIPERLKGLGSIDNERGELAQYFVVLLHYLHAEEMDIELIDGGYQLSFTLPITVVSDVISNGRSFNTLHAPVLREELTSKLINELPVQVTHYCETPVEALVAVDEPSNHHQVISTLKLLGLQTVVVSSKEQLEQYWQTGRFTVLLTGIEFNPYVEFSTEEQLRYLPRVILSLANNTQIAVAEGKFSAWEVKQLSTEIKFEQVEDVLAPWLSKSQLDLKLEVKKDSDTEKNLEVSFDFDKYIQHQGSWDIALYMLDEYTQENAKLAGELSQAFSNTDLLALENVINALTENSKILSAKHLLSLCRQWCSILNDGTVDSHNSKQTTLLNNTVKAIESVNHYADEVA